MGHGNIISLQCCLNCVKEALSPNLPETNMGVVGRDAFGRGRKHKHADTTVSTCDQKRAGNVIRQTAHLVCSGGESLFAGYKPKRYLYDDLAPHFRICGDTASSQKNDRG